MSIYERQIRDALSAAIDTRKLAEAWQALHPREVSKAIDPALSAFLGAARAAIMRALRAVLGRLWPEAWVLGQQSALALVDVSVTTPDWAGWTPGDYLAAEQVAGPGLRQLLDASGITIQSIADSRVEELAQVLEDTLRSDEVHRPPLPEPLPPMLSVGDLTRQLKEVLDKPERARMVAHTEIARAQVAAAETTYAEHGIAEIDVLTAEDDRVCRICSAAEDANPHALGTLVLPLHPVCRCAPSPVVAGAA